MKVVYALGLLAAVSIFGCSGEHSQPTHASAAETGLDTGGTSSGGPAARLKIYGHCTANVGFLALDFAGDLSTQSASLSTGINACSNAWSTFNYSYSAGVITAASGSQQLVIGGPLTSDPNAPSANFAAVWTDNGNSAQMTCTLYDGYLSTVGCASGETQILNCSSLGTSVCIEAQDN